MAEFIRMGTLARLGSAALVVAGGAHLLPSVAAIGPLRRRLLPRLSGSGDRGHLALTFDDGPDPAATPAFLDGLADARVRATFFLIGTQLAANPDLGRRIVACGHEVAVHGWTHRAHLLRTPRAITKDLSRASACVREVTGQVPVFWRPPHGIATGAGLAAARRLGLRPVLWTADGRDWRPDATAASVIARIESTLDGGGVVLLHDSGTQSAPGAWQAALAALPLLVDACRSRGLDPGPLSEHGIGDSPHWLRLERTGALREHRLRR